MAHAELGDERIHTLWCADLPPRLTVASGDTVTVTCRDGFDGQIPRALADPPPRGTRYETIDFSRVAPLTGPIAVTGAEVGGTVEVQILELTPTGTASTVIAPDFLGLDFLHAEHRAAFPGEWIRTFDMDKAVADGYLAFTDRIRLPLRPMLGMVGAAPAAGSFTTGPPRSFGGNMDVRDVGAGASVFLPVRQPGALVSLGDGHAIQGDGEVCGTAVETPIRATVRLIAHPGQRLAEPRVETDDAVMLIGHGRTLDAAARHAIRQGIDYLTAHAGLDEYEAYALISCACDLRVNQVVDFPHLGARLVIPRSLLP